MLEKGQIIQLAHGQIVTVARLKPEWNEGYLHCFIDPDNVARWVDIRNWETETSVG